MGLCDRAVVVASFSSEGLVISSERSGGLAARRPRPSQQPELRILSTPRLAWMASNRKISLRETCCTAGISAQSTTAMWSSTAEGIDVTPRRLSALPPKADVRDLSRHVSFVPIVLQNDFGHSSAQD
jgi:hypothetical protein